MSDRRSFLKQAALVTGALATGLPTITMAETQKQKRPNKLCFFTKHLQGLPFDDIASIAAEMDVDGIEAPIRTAGHVEPEQVEVELPKLVEALKKQNLEITIMTSGINQISAEQHTEKVLRTAAQLGIKRYRMNYFRYDLNKPIWPQLDDIRAKIKDLVALSSELGIQPLFQNHSGKDYVAAPIWDMYSIMREYTPQQFGFAFDIFHATVEGGLSWPLEASLVADHYGAVYFKDFQWVGRKAQNCPLGEGQINPDFAKMLVKRKYQGPISLHVEYLKGNTKDPAFVKECREYHVRDLKVLKEWMQWA